MSEQTHPLELIDRERVLHLLAEHLTSAWTSFDRPRPREPQLDAALQGRLGEGLPEAPEDPAASLADVASVLDASISPSRPLYAAYIGSTGLEAGVLAGALTNAYDVNLAAAAGAAELLENQTLRWVAEFVGYPVADGAFTSGGMTSNLTALMAAREHALPGARHTGVGARAAALYCSEEAHHSVARAVEVIGLGSQALRRIPVDDRRRMRVDALAQALALRHQRRGRAGRGRGDGGHHPDRARSTRSPRSPRSARGMESGCTSTAPTAGQPPAFRAWRRCSPASTARTR